MCTVSGSSTTHGSTTALGDGLPVRVNTAAGTLAARATASGGVFVNETDAVTLNVLGAANVAGGGAAYDLPPGNTIMVAGVVNTIGTCSTTLTASAGNIAIGASVGNT